MSGFIKIYRTYFDHWTWTKKREYSEAEAWLDLLQSAQWQPCKQLVKGKLIEVNRGELLASLRFLQERWGWGSPNRVSRYLEIIENDGMICIKNETVTQRITICKYETYNSVRNTDGTDTEQTRNTDGTDTEQTRNKDKNNKNIKKERKEETPIQAGGFDFEKLANEVGRTCAKLLIDGGVGKQLDEPKRKLLRQWLAHQNQKGNQITTTLELHTLLETFKANTAEALQAGIKKSAAWKVLVIETPKTDGKNGSFPDDWSPQIEAKFSGVELSRYWQHLTAKGWERKMMNGQPIGWTKKLQLTQN